MKNVLELENASLSDIKDVFDLSNNSIVRQNSIHHEHISWNEHTNWFENKLNDTNSFFYTIKVDNIFAGYIRLDRENKEYIVTIHLKDEFRNHGFGSKALTKLTEKHNKTLMKALVKVNNISSFNCFKKCGFYNKGITSLNNETYLIMMYLPKVVIAVSNDLYNETNLFSKPNITIITNKDRLTKEELSKLNPSYIFLPHWSYIIPKDIYENFTCVIFHMTDLPFGRGGSPMQNLIEREIYETKISAIQCREHIDAGDIYLKHDFSLKNGSAQELYKEAGKIISEMIDYIRLNNPEPVPQSGEVVTFKRRAHKDSNLEDAKSLNKIYDYIRMLDAVGYPKAFLEHKGFRYEFQSVKKDDDKLLAEVLIREIK